MTRRQIWLPAYLLLTAGTALAQMGMGGGMGGGTRGGYGGMMGSSLGGMMGGSLSGMMGGGAGLTLGPDGTLYLTRSAQSQTTQPPTTQLSAIDLNGAVKWTLPLNAGSASQPAMGKDGTLFVTTSDWLSWMYDWMYSRSIPAAATTPNLLVIKPGTTAAITATVPLAGQLASAPQIAADSAGNYVVYVVCVDAFSGLSLNTTATSGAWLYAFSPAGTLKFKLQLSQGGTGIMGPGMMGGF